MSTVLGRVLVIDDDPLMLKVLCELLVQAGFQVFVRASPVGATQVILRERVDAAVIDWSLPVLRGSDVIRLLRTWDEVKNLPVLLVTGAPESTIAALRAELPDIRIIGKEHLREELVSALGSVVGSGMTARGLQPVTLGPSGEFEAPPQRPKTTDLVPQLLTQLTQTLSAVDVLWGELARGERESLTDRAQKLEQLAGQAQLLALDEVAALLQELCDTLRALPHEGEVPGDVRRAVERGIAALSTLPQTSDAAFTIPPEPVIGALRKARTGLSQRP